LLEVVSGRRARRGSIPAGRAGDQAMIFFFLE
jgi:hypothetical protein